MRRSVILSIGIASVMAGVLVAAQLANPVGNWMSLVAGRTGNSMLDERSNAFHDAGMSSETSVELVLDIEHYDDFDYGFSMAIPAGWRRIVTTDVAEGSESQSSVVAGSQDEPSSAAGADPAWMEPGYAVGFESTQQHGHDQFADYILVEILPGESSGLFSADVNHRQSVVIDGRSAWYDRLEIKQADTGLTDVDLVIYQTELAGVGYTVGLYAIGEQTSERIMAIAFEVMLQTFRIDRPPFSVS